MTDKLSRLTKQKLIEIIHQQRETITNQTGTINELKDTLTEKTIYRPQIEAARELFARPGIWERTMMTGLEELQEKFNAVRK